MDVATPQLWTEAVFGLTSGWWRFTDRDLRPVHPLLGRSQWEAVLREAGFNETASLPGLIGPQGEGQIGILARKAWQASADRRARSRKCLRKNPGLFLPTKPVSDAFSRAPARGRYPLPNRAPRKQFATTETDTFTLRAEAPEDWTNFSRRALATPRRSGSSTSGTSTRRSTVMGRLGTDALLHLVQTLDGPARQRNCESTRSRAARKPSGEIQPDPGGAGTRLSV